MYIEKIVLKCFSKKIKRDDVDYFLRRSSIKATPIAATNVNSSNPGVFSATCIDSLSLSYPVNDDVISYVPTSFGAFRSIPFAVVRYCFPLNATFTPAIERPSSSATVTLNISSPFPEKSDIIIFRFLLQVLVYLLLVLYLHHRNNLLHLL